VAIWILAGLAIILAVSITFGLHAFIIDSFWAFLAGNAVRFGVMLVIVIGGYVILRIVSIFFSEYKRHSKLHPFTLNLFQVVTRYLVYAIVTVLLATNLLVMAGLQTIAGTMVELFTVFIGLVVSFAATGSIGNALSGLVIMSWRPYKEGDRVDIANGVYGDVVEMEVMFTQIRTIKNEIVHVPNSQVLSNKIVNYSTLPKIIVHQDVTIGYDVPRKRVEKLLKTSASKTTGLLAEPDPFVLVRRLDNYTVAYEINAYTDKPSELVTAYSELMKNILDEFEMAGVEVLSPQHVAVRKSELTFKPKREKAIRRP
jgi:small-conductance mechanosensitive channel